MPKTLADARTKLSILVTKPTDPDAVTAAQANAGVDMSCAVLSSDYVLGATDSDTINEKALCDEGNASVFGASNYAAGMTFFRFLDEDGQSDSGADIAFETFTGKGVTVYALERVGPKYDEPWATGDIYNLYELVADNPQQPQDRTGYVKFRQPFAVGGVVALRKAIAAGA